MTDPETERIAARSFLGQLPRELLDELLTSGDRADYPDGATIYRDGDEPRTLLVLRGLLRVFMTSPEGRQVTVRYARPADVLGIAVLVGGPADVSVQALEEVSLFRLDARVLRAAAKRDAQVSWALAEELNRRLYESLHHTAVNAFGSVRQRVAAHLLDLASTHRTPESRLVARVSQQELSDAVGSSREVVARVLRDLRSEGLVATGSETIHVLDPVGLQAQCWSPPA
jgi:CRP/FNR family cyclic AMP-dependent transcriptional regulator